MMLDGPNQLWVADITYVAIMTGFVLIAPHMSAFGGKADITRTVIRTRKPPHAAR
jgi:hypothetical protein